MNGSSDTVVLARGEQPSDEELFWLGVGREMVKESTNLANDAARQLVTLTSALCTVYIAAGREWKIFPAGEWWGQILGVLPVAMWLLGLLSSMLAIFPKKYSIVSICVEDIKRAKEDAIDRKNRCLFWSMIFLMAGILAMAVVLLYL